MQTISYSRMLGYNLADYWGDKVVDNFNAYRDQCSQLIAGANT